MVIPWIIPTALVVVLRFIRVLSPRLFPGTLTWRYTFRCRVKEQDVATEFRESCGTAGGWMWSAARPSPRTHGSPDEAPSLDVGYPGRTVYRSMLSRCSISCSR